MIWYIAINWFLSISKFRLGALIFVLSPPPTWQYDQLYPDKAGSQVIEGPSDRQPVESDDPSSALVPANPETSEKAYNMAVLKQVQIIFAHLARSKLQFYIPKGFWKQFRWACYDYNQPALLGKVFLKQRSYFTV